MPSHHAKPRRSAYFTDPFASGSSSSEETPDVVASSDEALDHIIRQRFAQLNLDLTSVNIAVQDGVVTLTGLIHDRKSKYQLEYTAAQIRGVVDVENLLKLVTPPR